MRSRNEYYSSVNNVIEGIQTESFALYLVIRRFYYGNSSYFNYSECYFWLHILKNIYLLYMLKYWLQKQVWENNRKYGVKYLLFCFL